MTPDENKRKKRHAKILEAKRNSLALLQAIQREDETAVNFLLANWNDRDTINLAGFALANVARHAEHTHTTIDELLNDMALRLASED